MNEPAPDDTALPPPSPGTDVRLKRLGKLVRGLREARGLTQDEFARRCAISVSYTSLLERGSRSPSYETLARIAQTLDVPTAELLRSEPGSSSDDVAHLRLLEFVKRARLTRAQVERLMAVARAMFDLDQELSGKVQPCSVPGCGRPPLARGLCAPHYHRQRRAQRRS